MRVWRTFLVVQMGLTREPLPRIVARLARQHLSHPQRRHSPFQLSKAVDRGLRVGPWEPTCLVKSLVLYRLLQEQGDPAELVIGLPAHPTNHAAHAWVELDRMDVGPPPGRGQHLPLARFGPEPIPPPTTSPHSGDAA